MAGPTRASRNGPRPPWRTILSAPSGRARTGAASAGSASTRQMACSARVCAAPVPPLPSLGDSGY
jgi:hypothetical protein